MLLLSVMFATMALASFSQQSPRGVRKSDDAETLPGNNGSQNAVLIYEAAQQAGGLNVGGAILTATNRNGFNSVISVTYDHEIEPGVIVPITVEYEPPPNQARATSMRLFRLDLEATMREFPPHKKTT